MKIDITNFVFKYWKWFVLGAVILLSIFIGLIVGNMKQMDDFFQKPITDITVMELIYI